MGRLTGFDSGGSRAHADVSGARRPAQKQGPGPDRPRDRRPCRVHRPGHSLAAPAPAVLTFKTVKVGAPGNPSVGIVPFNDAVYHNCAEAP